MNNLQTVKVTEHIFELMCLLKKEIERIERGKWSDQELEQLVGHMLTSGPVLRDIYDHYVLEELHDYKPVKPAPDPDADKNRLREAGFEKYDLGEECPF